MKAKLLALLTVFTFSISAFANPVIPIPTQPQMPVFTPSAPNLNAAAYLLMDATSGKILAQKDADKQLPPASLTKLMSLYIISGALKMVKFT